MKNTIKAIVLCAILATVGACEKSEDQTPQTGGIFISTMVPNSDGMSGGAYMQLIKDISEVTYDNTNAFPSSYSIPPVIVGKNVFVLPGSSTESNTLKKYSFENQELVEKGQFIVPANSFPTDIATKGDKAYIALRNMGGILVINHESMTEIKTIDITSYGIGDQNPDPTMLIIRDNYLFVALHQIDGGYIPNPKRPAVDILVINLDTNEPVKIITESTSGMTWPASATDQNSMFMDEQQNIYISCFGTLGMFKSGFLRINAGETDFDKDYQFIMSETTIEGDPNKLNYLNSVMYYENNMAYGIANVPAYFNSPTKPDYFNDRFNLPVEIDLAAKTIKTVGLPRSNGYGYNTSKHNDQIIFGLATENDNGFFTYSPKSGAASSKAVITVTGYPYKFYQFK